ncbi:hypothetical protein GCM10025856_21990 [Methylophaga marina]|nr:hypothetical protein GCM10025856_21990 [Methylophaga marina]
MKLLECPVNGIRPMSEFTYGGEYRNMPNPDTCSDSEWAAYVHYRNGAPGLKKNGGITPPAVPGLSLNVTR